MVTVARSDLLDTVCGAVLHGADPDSFQSVLFDECAWQVLQLPQAGVEQFFFDFYYQVGWAREKDPMARQRLAQFLGTLHELTKKSEPFEPEHWRRIDDSRRELRANPLSHLRYEGVLTAVRWGLGNVADDLLRDFQGDEKYDGAYWEILSERAAPDERAEKLFLLLLHVPFVEDKELLSNAYRVVLNYARQENGLARQIKEHQEHLVHNLLTAGVKGNVLDAIHRNTGAPLLAVVSAEQGFVKVA